MTLEIPKVPAFKKELAVSKLNHWLADNKLTEFMGDDRYVVRKALDRRNEAIYDAKQEAVIAKKLFDELREGYGINAPVHFVVARDTTEKDELPDLFVITEYVKEIDLSKESDVERLAAQEGYTSIVRSLLSYYSDKYRNGSRFLTDLAHAQQYKYGILPDNNRHQWYLIDTDVFHSRRPFQIYESVELLMSLAEEAEDYYHVDLSDIKTKCSQLMRKIEAEDTNIFEDADKPDLSTDSAADLYKDPGI
jgi:hypothetical protein